jgi:hypothetical protein
MCACELQTAAIELAQLGRLLLPSPSSSLSRTAAHQTALSLLNAVNTSPLNLITAQLSTLVTTLTRALSVQSRTLRPDLRLSLALLRVLNSLATKAVLWPTDATISTVTVLAHWAYHGAGTAGGAEPRPPDRGGGMSGGVARTGLAVGASGGFGGVMGSFRAVPGLARSSGTLRSLSRSSSTSSIGRGWTTDESDDDEARAATRA